MDWLELYLKMEENTEPPVLFKKWAGVSVLVACMQRRCWLRWDTDIFPNFYTVLVGPSGSRKGTAMRSAQRLIVATGVPTAAEATTREALLRTLAESVSSYADETGMPVIHCSLTAFSPEFAVFLGYDNKQFISDLCDLFDCPSRWKYRTKNSGTDDIQGAWLNIFGATTPILLQNTLPRDAVGAGLTSRMVFVYGDKKSKIVPFPIRTDAEIATMHLLTTMLQDRLAMQGEMVPTTEYLDAYAKFYEHDQTVRALDDPVFEPYLTRRSTHLRKLSMVMSASRGVDMQLKLEDFERAHALLLETEREMPNVFSGYGRVETADMFPRIMALISAKGIISYSFLMNSVYKDMTRQQLDDMLITLAGIGFCKVELTERGGKIIRHIADGGASIQ